MCCGFKNNSNDNKTNQNKNNKNIASKRYLLALPKITRTFLLRIDSQISVHICMVPSHSLFLFLWQRSTRRGCGIKQGERLSQCIFQVCHLSKHLPSNCCLFFFWSSCHPRQVMFNQSKRHLYDCKNH